MALNDFLLEILVCPTTKQKVAPASPEVVLQINGEIERGGLRDVGGEVVAERVDGLLLRDDGSVAYPVRGDIPEMLVERGISMDASA
jgi:uncharacterized protein YbaR (Trm112 family)